ncbi:MAG TPA: acyloxyacyl hydrolase [Candidatus Limnocylindrales bacterium]|nr:acyloxyacyl hydrolase [Candidatus Limnocylindrales bacterium]
MKLLAAIAAALLLCCAAAAQDFPSQSLTRGTWDFGAFIGGGLGLGKSSSTQFFDAGGRAGLALTGEHLPGLLRGNFEWAVDAMPVYPVFTTKGVVYGGSFKPVIWQWNFTHGKRLAPYVAAAGGIVFTTSNVPPGDTSTVNFTSQLVVGTRIFTRSHRAFFFEGELGHLSNASLGNHNPGYNITLLFNVGYSWIKARR